MNNDSLLLKQIASGNEEAFKMLFEKHRPKLYNYLVRITKSKEVAEEIVLDVFLKLWIGKELLQGIENIDGFLFTVARNKALDFFRIASRDIRLQKFIAGEMELAQENSADCKLLDSEYSAILHKAITKLSPRRQVIFRLSRMDGFTHEQIADKLNLSRNTVRNTIAETLKSIRIFLHSNDVNSVLLLLIFSVPG